MLHAPSQSGDAFLTPAQVVRRWGDIPVLTLVGLGLVFAAAAFNLVNVEVDKDKVALDLQVALKLAICGCFGLYGGWGFISDSRIRDIMLTFPGAWLTVIIGFYVLAVPTALDPTNALASAVTMTAVVLGTIVAVTQIGILPVLNSMFYGCGCFVVGSWVVFFIMPEIGVFEEPLPNGQHLARMSGLAHPNTLGQFSSLTIVLGIVLWKTYNFRSMIRMAFIVLAVGALVASLSRTSMAAAVFALTIGYRRTFWRREYTSYYLMFGFLALLGLMVALITIDVPGLIEEKLTSISKSGDSDELATATGRADIWAYTLRLVAESPLTGYGAASSKYLLQDYCMYTHNLVLNVALSTGVAGAICTLMMLLTRIAMMFRSLSPMADAIVAFIFLNGLVENVVFSPIAGLPTMIFVIGLVWWCWDRDPVVIDDLKSDKVEEVVQ